MHTKPARTSGEKNVWLRGHQSVALSDADPKGGSHPARGFRGGTMAAGSMTGWSLSLPTRPGHPPDGWPSVLVLPSVGKPGAAAMVTPNSSILACQLPPALSCSCHAHQRSPSPLRNLTGQERSRHRHMLAPIMRRCAGRSSAAAVRDTRCVPSRGPAPGRSAGPAA